MGLRQRQVRTLQHGRRCRWCVDGSGSSGCFCVSRYAYGKPVRGHMNITFLYYFHGTEDVLYEDRMVGGLITHSKLDSTESLPVSPHEP